MRIHLKLFKYITCVGSRIFQKIITAVLLDLNTSHVSVQALELAEAVEEAGFKYITCVGSRQLQQQVERHQQHLNTSHVSVQDGF